MKTKTKILLISIISKILKIFIKDNIICKRNNILWNLDISEGIDLAVFLFGISEKKIQKIAKLLNINKKIIILDIGANIGSVSLNLAKLYRKSKIYSFEPTNFAYKKLMKNLSLNPLLQKQIFTKQLFISDKKQPLHVYSSWNLSNYQKKHPVHFGKLKKVKLKSLTSLDKLTVSLKEKKIDFIKLDVDGYELNVLKSGETFFKKNKPIIFIEIAPYLYREYGYECKHLISYIRFLGYLFYNENLRRVIDIDNYIKKINYGSSKNFFLIKKKFKPTT